MRRLIRLSVYKSQLVIQTLLNICVAYLEYAHVPEALKQWSSTCAKFPPRGRFCE